MRSDHDLHLYVYKEKERETKIGSKRERDRMKRLKSHANGVNAEDTRASQDIRESYTRTHRRIQR